MKNRIFGFLLGSTVTGVASYFYVYEEYKHANDLLAEDIDVSSGVRMRGRGWGNADLG